MILCKNENESLQKLLEQITKFKAPQDKIYVVRDKNGTNSKTKYIIESYKAAIIAYERPVDRAIHDQKNWLAKQSNTDYLFYLDADELLDERFYMIVHQLVEENDVDVFFLPRTNIVLGLTEQYRASRGWKLDEKGRVNWPDVQDRLFRNKKGIHFNPIPHGRLIGHDTFSMLPEEELYAIYHEKSMEKQKSDNEWHDNKERELGLRP
tara:strand:- start:1162 stop:1785 length:624 start_codon:yes stop_codon:yes gene_type:complete